MIRDRSDAVTLLDEWYKAEASARFFSGERVNKETARTMRREADELKEQILQAMLRSSYARPS